MNAPRRTIALLVLALLASCASEAKRATPDAVIEPEPQGRREATTAPAQRDPTAMPAGASTTGTAGASGKGSGNGAGGNGGGSGAGSGGGGSGGSGSGGSGGGSGSGTSGGASGGGAGSGASSPGGSGASGAQSAGGTSGRGGGSSGGSGSSSSAGGAAGGSAGSAGSAGAAGSAGGASGAASTGSTSGGSGRASGSAGATAGTSVGSGAAGGATPGGTSSGAARSASGGSGASASGGAKGGGGAGNGSGGGTQAHLMEITSNAVAGTPARVPTTARGTLAATTGRPSGARPSAGKPTTTAPTPTSGGVVRAASFDGENPDRIPDAVGQSTRGADGGARRDTTGVLRGSTLDAGTSAQPTDARQAGSASGSSRGERDAASAPARADSQERIEVPEAHADAGEALDEVPALAEERDSPLRPLHAHWQQVKESGNDPDFGPGGYDLSLLSIRPTQKSVVLHRAWGDPTQQQVGGEFRAEFLPAGTLRLSPAPSAPSRFDARPVALPAQGGRPARTITPPTRALPLETTWKIEGDELLRFDGRLYRRIDEKAFAQLQRGNASAPTDLAARASRSRDAKGRSEPAGGVDFFGARAEGTHICYACDISGSMDGFKLQALRDELKRSIGALPDGTHVQVVFFNDTGRLISPGWKTTGTPGCDALLRGIAQTGCGGNTDPTLAIEYAFTQLDPRPDTLFLLTDGQFECDALGQLARLNPRTDQTRVQTIGLGPDVLKPALQAIAAANGGTFVHVPANGP